LDLNLKNTFLDVDPEILKDLWLSISWDNEKTPSVFGANRIFLPFLSGVHPYRNIAIGN